MNTMAATHTLDVRGLSHEEKQGRLFPLLESLKGGEALHVTFDFDPLPLVYMLGSKPELKVTKEQKGPQEWVMQIAKAGAGPKALEPQGTMATKETLKTLLRELKADGVTDETKARAKKLLSSVDAKTLGLLEQELIQEGISHQEIRQSLCDVHLEAMRDTLVAQRIEVSAPHPVHTLMEEHKLIVDGLHKLKDVVERLKQRRSYADLGADLQTLRDVSHLMVEAELHHQREEEALFPKLYEHGITEPPDIMQEEHVEFRARKRALFSLVNKGTETPFEEFREAVIEHGEFLTRELESHIFKEDNILYQIALQVFTEDDWRQVKRACDKIGYCCFKPQDQAAVLREKVEKALDTIRPALQADGGDVELVEVTEDGVVQVELVGACGGCPMSQMTLQRGIEHRLREMVPEVTRVFG